MPGQFATGQGRSGVWEARPLTPAPPEESETLLQVVSSDGVLYIRTPAATRYGYLPEQGSKLLVQHRYAEVNGVRLRYATGGRGKLLLFLHGFPEFWYAWRNQLTEFAAECQAVAPDLRGYNLSSKPAAVEQYQVPQLVEDAVALAAHSGTERVHARGSRLGRHGRLGHGAGKCQRRGRLGRAKQHSGSAERPKRAALPPQRGQRDLRLTRRGRRARLSPKGSSKGKFRRKKPFTRSKQWGGTGIILSLRWDV
jgi:hypothetical protein